MICLQNTGSGILNKAHFTAEPVQGGNTNKDVGLFFIKDGFEFNITKDKSNIKNRDKRSHETGDNMYSFANQQHNGNINIKFTSDKSSLFHIFRTI